MIIRTHRLFLSLRTKLDEVNQFFLEFEFLPKDFFVVRLLAMTERDCLCIKHTEVVCE